MAGAGAEYAWAGEKTGEGKMTLTESKPGEHIAIKLEFIKPMAATNTVDFNFKPTANGTNVVWSMTGHNNFVGKAFSLVFDMDKMVGGMFEQGLAQMKSIVERSS